MVSHIHLVGVLLCALVDTRLQIIDGVSHYLQVAVDRVSETLLLFLALVKPIFQQTVDVVRFVVHKFRLKLIFGKSLNCRLVSHLVAAAASSDHLELLKCSILILDGQQSTLALEAISAALIKLCVRFALILL